MFTGMMRLEGLSCSSSSSNDRTDSLQLHSARCSLEDEPVILPNRASSCKKRLHRRPGYMRGEQPKCLESIVEENSKRPCQQPGMSKKIYTDIQKYGLETCRILNLKESIDTDHHTVQYSNSKAAANSVVNVPEFIQQSLTSSSCRNCDNTDASWKGSWPRECQTNQQNNKLLEWKRKSVKVEPALQEMPGTPSKENDNDSRDSVDDSFNSSFSFIQISLNSSHEVENVGNDSKHLPAVGLEEPTILQAETDCGFSKMDKTDHFFSKVLWTDAASMSWQYNLIDESQPITDANMKQRMQDLDTFSVDTEAVFSFSVDSSNAVSTGSSVTSGYESSTSTDHTWDAVLKKYDGFLQDCLQSNRSNIKIESLLLKLQKLQEKAIREDDYDRADKFRKKLVELKRERSTLKVGLPSRHPAVSRFLEKLKDQAQLALQQAYSDCGSNNKDIEHSQKIEKEVTCSGQEKTQGSIFRRDRLIQEKQQLQKEIQNLRRKLAELEVKEYQLSMEIKEEDRLIQSQDSEVPSLLNTPLGELQDMYKALDEMGNSVHRNYLFTEIPHHIKSLKERERSLSTTIKEATAKVFMSQKLCSSLRKKASDIETQLPTLHEAKMVSISGNDFSTAKDLKEEMRSLSLEKDRLEELIKKLQPLRTGNDRSLDMTKEDYIRVKQELALKKTQFENNLKDSAAKYIELLEDKLNSCGNQLLERVWEADLEACYLLVQGLHLKEAGCCMSEGEESRADDTEPMDDPCSVTETKKECDVWEAVECFEQNDTELTETLEGFLFGKEDNHPEDACCGPAHVTEQCESISKKLLSLEDQLQTAILHRDEDKAQSLQREIQMVKATLQAMLEQLQASSEEGEKEMEDFFSDSW
ncbi:disrupted in schizophrenia 1 protein isoform X2 [Acipenser oxyrinchus oxyrinchus]|uniref:Disrupted in schizophrenia 1 protein isoform X2 n=1 Tax=Acipenser oxyrinchus oxyrinchus TaxID=40147 RepID=A0AAD8LKN2_ACIOX|nr:disrupted in schizophrenia 1 protein isoform X2 [Acipenser oxyrinchus oxyrinchus]